MLVSKFSVPIIRYTSLNNLKNVLVRCASKNSCPDDIKRCGSSQEKIGGRLIIRSRCEENRNALAKCPKTYCKTDSPIAQPKCDSKVSDIYLQSLKIVEDYAKKLSKRIEDSMKPALQDLEAEIKRKRIEEATKREEILKSVDAKIWELVNLDTTCGMKKKKEILMINDQVSHELKHWKCEEPADMEVLRTQFEKFMDETKSKNNSAINLLKSCRKCNSPDSLQECVEEKTKEAIQILKCTEETISEKMIVLQNYKVTAMKDFASTLEDITESYRKTMKEFLENLSCFIDNVKNQGSIKRS